MVCDFENNLLTKACPSTPYEQIKIKIEAAKSSGVIDIESNEQ